MGIIAFITDGAVIDRIPKHLRGPVVGEGEWWGSHAISCPDLETSITAAPSRGEGAAGLNRFECVGMMKA